MLRNVNNETVLRRWINPGQIQSASGIEKNNVQWNAYEEFDLLETIFVDYVAINGRHAASNHIFHQPLKHTHWIFK